MAKQTKAELTKVNQEYKKSMKAKGRKMDRDGRVMAKDPLHDKPMNSFWHSIDPDRMEDALRSADDVDMQMLLTYMKDPDKRGVSMSKACRECGITLQKLNELYQKHNLALGMLGVSQHLPQVMVDTAQDAESSFELCDRCDGLGEIKRTVMVEGKAENVDEICPKCKGAREVRVTGDSKARDQIFKMVGLAGETGPLVAIQQNLTLGDTLDETLNAAQKLLIQPGGKG